MTAQSGTWPTLYLYTGGLPASTASYVDWEKVPSSLATSGQIVTTEIVGLYFPGVKWAVRLPGRETGATIEWTSVGQRHLHNTSCQAQVLNLEGASMQVLFWPQFTSTCCIGIRQYMYNINSLNYNLNEYAVCIECWQTWNLSSPSSSHVCWSILKSAENDWFWSHRLTEKIVRFIINNNILRGNQYIVIYCSMEIFFMDFYSFYLN